LLLLLLQVRHPGVSEAIERDFQTMVWLAHLAGQMLPATRALRLDDTLKQFAAPLHEQVRAAAAAAAAAA
jgi:predicted unusual protein kinase regulating ubiquinone biosynthesis (AarF/ABC1/UbiB family)